MVVGQEIGPGKYCRFILEISTYIVIPKTDGDRDMIEISYGDIERTYVTDVMDNRLSILTTQLKSPLFNPLVKLSDEIDLLNHQILIQILP